MRKLFLVLVLVILMLGTIFFFWFSQKYTVPILMYHNISYERGSFFVSPEIFARQMEYIKRNGYEVITLDDLVESIRNKKLLGRKKVVITFDDGYKDNFKYAYPVLKKFGFPATVFLVTDFIGNEKKFLSWEEVMLMSKGGVSFGAHTRAHFYLGSLNNEKTARDEIESSKKAIENKLGIPVDYFCYPSGAFNEKTKELVINAGYKGACTTNRGFARFNSDVYELKRIKVTNSDATKPFSFWAKLSGYYTVFKKEKSPN
jgi:peptidoglycan/xylan/chitin deacetylase (PgdA/CDA1 family)